MTIFYRKRSSSSFTKNSASIRNNHSVNLGDQCNDDHGDAGVAGDDGDDGDDGDAGDAGVAGDAGDDGVDDDENLIRWPIVDHAGHLTTVLRVKEHSFKNQFRCQDRWQSGEIHVDNYNAVPLISDLWTF